MAAGGVLLAHMALGRGPQSSATVAQVAPKHHPGRLLWDSWVGPSVTSSGAIPALALGRVCLPARTCPSLALPRHPSSPRNASVTGAAPSHPAGPGGGRTAGNHIGVSCAVISHLHACSGAAPGEAGPAFQVRGCMQTGGKFPFPHQDFNCEVAWMRLLHPSSSSALAPSPLRAHSPSSRAHPGKRLRSWNGCRCQQVRL